MAHHTMTGVSADNTAKTHTIDAPEVNSSSTNKKKIILHSITVTTSGADIAADVGVLITASHTGDTWNAELRSGKVFGMDKVFGPNGWDCGHDDVTIVTDAGGAGVVVTVSVHYEVI